MERDLRQLAFRQGWTEQQINALIGLLLEHSGLLFKHGHALALAHRAYQQAQRKVDTGTSASWFAACLSAGGSQHGLGAAAEEARRFGVVLVPPCVNRSNHTFVVDAKAPELEAAVASAHGAIAAIRVPLAAIRGLSQESAGHILSVRAAFGPFAGLLDFLRKVDHRLVSRNDLLLLIKLGAFGFTGLNRRQLTIIEQLSGATADVLRTVERDPTGLADLDDSVYRTVLEDVEEWPPEVLAALSGRSAFHHSRVTTRSC